MIARIQMALQACEIAVWQIHETREETAELFFVRKALDTRRAKQIRSFDVTVYRDGTAANGEKTRSCTSVRLLESMGDGRLRQELHDAYDAAQFAANPFYELPDPVCAPEIPLHGTLAEQPLIESGWKLAEALFASDTCEDAFVNSAELFLIRRYHRMLSSAGTDVSYTEASAEGEFVVQCRGEEDVEMHHTFCYDTLAVDALRQKVAEALTFVRDRACAKPVLKSGQYDLILSGNAVAELLSYYEERSDASMLYPQYSGWQIGDAVQGDGVTGELLNLTLSSQVPYDGEGIPLQELALVQDGRLCAVHGSNRLCRYLGVQPTGRYSKLCCANGTLPFADLKRQPCLWVVAFSDFQMDSFSGHFGGEIRLAYWIQDDKAIPVTGGSVNGSLMEAQKHMLFSNESYESAAYQGPYAVRLSGIRVAGAEHG